MKKIIFLGLMLVCAFSFSQAQQTDITKVLKFTNDTYDFGKIPTGKPAEYEIAITNISSESVSIDNVQVGCHCTKPKYNQGEKILPGETVKITLGFDAGVIGAFTRAATIFFNNGALSKSVTFKGECVQVQQQPATPPTN